MTNILAVADSGMHKSRFLLDCPNPFVYDFDKGLSGGLEVLPHATFRDISPKMSYIPEMERSGLFPAGMGWMKFIQHLNPTVEKILRKQVNYQMLGLDSLTFMQELAMSKILVDTKQDQPHQGSYGAQQKYLKEVLNALTVLPVHVYATAHIQRDTNDLTQVVEKLPLLTGKLAGLIGAFFDEVWFIDTVDDKGTAQKPNLRGVKWVIKTKPTPMNRQAKSRADIPDGTEFTWEAVRPYLEVKPQEEKPKVLVLK